MEGIMEHHAEHDMKGSYKKFAVELGIDFIIMYLVMYTMIASLDHFYLNLNNVYMTLMMVSPMAIVMLLAMRSMFSSRRLNWIIIGGALVIFAASFIAMRNQTVIDNEEFLKSMIPHHSGAILMCEQAAITDPEIIQLCAGIIQGQAEEISQMQRMLERY